MPAAAYKDLCIDASDAHALAAFWAVMLDLEPRLHEDGMATLSAAGRVLVWVNAVSEATTVKNRLHLDVRAESLDPALAAGASVLAEQPRWTVMKDPDGQEFCIFVREPPVRDRFYELVWDVTGNADAAHRLAQWWGQALGADVMREKGWSSVEKISGTPFEAIVFQPVPEDKTTKNRVHIDVFTEDLRALVALGAVVLREKGAGGTDWTVLADPAGNEFCAFTPEP
jgi:hypothetical protein